MRTLLGASAALALLAVGCGPRAGDSVDPASPPEHLQVGIASWYGHPFTGRPTASGEIYDPRLMTAASRTLPLGAVVQVTNLRNGRKVLVRINDRGPYSRGRILDCSEAAARKLGYHHAGTAKVAIDWPPQASATSEASKSSRYWVRLGAFESAQRARRLRRGASAHADSVALYRGSDYIHVHAGPYDKRRGAEAALGRLQQAGYLAALVQTPSAQLTVVD
jgi:rare lipoprotein A